MGKILGEMRSFDQFSPDPNIRAGKTLGTFEPDQLEKARALAHQEAASFQQDTAIVRRKGKLEVVAIPELGTLIPTYKSAAKHSHRREKAGLPAALPEPHTVSAKNLKGVPAEVIEFHTQHGPPISAELTRLNDVKIGEVKSGAWYEPDSNLTVIETLAAFDAQDIQKARTFAKMMEGGCALVEQDGRIYVCKTYHVADLGIGELDYLAPNVIEVAHQGRWLAGPLATKYPR